MISSSKIQFQVLSMKTKKVFIRVFHDKNTIVKFEQHKLNSRFTKLRLDL